MQEFESYIKSNYNVPNATACGIQYTYNTRVTQDRKSKVSIKNYIINMKLNLRKLKTFCFKTHRNEFNEYLLDITVKIK